MSLDEDTKAADGANQLRLLAARTPLWVTRSSANLKVPEGSASRNRLAATPINNPSLFTESAGVAAAGGGGWKEEKTRGSRIPLMGKHDQGKWDRNGAHRNSRLEG